MSNDLNKANKLYQFIKNNDIKQVQKFIGNEGEEAKNTINFTSAYYEQLAPVFVAIKSGNLELVQLLFEHGAKLELTDDAGRTPLYTAFSENKISIAEFLIEKGADIHAKTNLGNRVFDMAITTGNMYWIEYFIKNGAKLDYLNNEGYSTLYWASWANVETVKFIQEKSGLSFDLESELGLSPIYAAANLDVFNYILQQQPDIDFSKKNKDCFPILEFIQFGRTDIVNYLLDKGVDIKTVDDDGNGIMHHAIYSNNINMVNMLIARNADVHAKNSNGNSPVNEFKPETDLRIIEAVIKPLLILKEQEYACLTSFKVMKMIDAIEKSGLQDFYLQLYEGDGLTDILQLQPHVVLYVEGDVHFENFFLDDLAEYLNIQGFVINGNLTVDKAIFQPSMDSGPYLAVSGHVKCKNLYAGGSQIVFKQNLIAEQTVCGYYNDGTISVFGDTQAEVIISLEHTIILATISKGIVINRSEKVFSESKFEKVDPKDVLISDVFGDDDEDYNEDNEEEDDSDNGLNWYKIGDHIVDGKSILKKK